MVEIIEWAERYLVDSRGESLELSESALARVFAALDDQAPVAPRDPTD